MAIGKVETRLSHPAEPSPVVLWSQSVKSDVQRSHSPLRQLLYVEWILLGMAALLMLPSFVLHPGRELAWFDLVIAACLAAMGLYLPQRRWHKLGYTAVELGLLLLLTLGQAPAMMHLRPLLGLVVAIRSCQLFQLGGRVVVVAIVFALHGISAVTQGDIPLLATPPTQWQVSVFKVNLLVFFALVLVFVLLLVDALLSVYRSQQELALAHEQLRDYAARIENQATLQERNRIAREIHDSLGHALTAQTILLENALLYLPPQAEQAKTYLISAKESAYQALRDVSKSVSTLRNSPLQGQSLTTAIPNLVADLCQSAHLRSECWVNVPEALPDDVKLALFRIVQEALTNAIKHSRATAVQVKLAAKRNRVHLQVFDNGQGFDPGKNTSGFGLRGMRERATALGGTCQLWSAPGSGCRISVILPLPKVIDHSA